jgi:hypothetical protein
MVFAMNCHEFVFQFASKPSVHCQFFKAFEISRTDSALIPNLFQRTRTDGSLILQQLKNWNQQFFINSNNQATVVITL